MVNWWNKKSKKQKVGLLILLGLVVVCSIFAYNQYHKPTIEIPLSRAVQLSQINAFSEMEFDTENDFLSLTIAEGKTPSVVDINGEAIILASGETVVVKSGSLNLKDLQDIGFVLPEIYGQTEDGVVADWMDWLRSILLLGLLLALLWLFMGGYLFGGAGSRYKRERETVSFADIGGFAGIKGDIKEVVGFLKDRSHFERLGAQIPRGILLVGPPGTGKTMLARAMATEADVPFFYSSGAEFHTMWVGMAALRIKNLFRKARKYPNSVVFIDEFDAIAHKRILGSSDVSREWSHTLDQLLAEMDGFKKDTSVLVVAATNRPEVLDPAVLRSGRFDRRINVFLPNQSEREEILGIHGRGKPFADDVNMGSIARQTSGMSGADLAALLNEAAIVAGKEHKAEIGMADITKAIDKVLVGDERKGLNLSLGERRLFAYHEAGHAVVASFTSTADRVQRVSILPHGQAGGFARFSVETERVLFSKAKLIDSITVLLGGRASEEIATGDISSGVQDDIRRANSLAREMVSHYGMGEKFGLRYSGFDETGIKELGNQSCDALDAEVGTILDRCYNSAKGIVAEHREILDKVAARLLEAEALDGEEIDRLIKGDTEKR